MTHSARRSFVIATAILASGALLGGLFGNRVRADSRRPEDQLFTFGRVLALIEDNYVGEVDSTQMVEDAIAGMLRTLDPHSNYLSAESFTEMRDEQRGKFHGLGIQITKRGADKPLTIIAPIDETPAHRAGLQSGDVIAEIEGESTLELTVQQAVRRLKGDKGTEVTITVERPGVDTPFDVTIERDEIPIESLRLAYMLEPGVGFVRISNFTSTTADELDRALAQLKDEGMTRLILDLRGNPGGLLDQAVQVSERFLPPGRKIVYTRGRIPGSNQDFLAKRGVQRIEIPLIVLVDNSSASASEIVSGAIQDHDRGLVVGETTFGKGLVQRVVPLRDGGALAVTTAKYYTPAGRLIQRDYSDLEEYYYTRGDDADTSIVEDADTEIPDDREIYYTDGGRKVFGGGGIHPDYVVESDGAPLELMKLLRENLIFDFAVLYSNSHPDIQPSGLVADEKLVGEFRAFLVMRDHEISEEDFAKSSDAIMLRVRSQIARVKWNQVEEGRVLAEMDPQIQAALELFDEAAALANFESGDPAARKSSGGQSL